MKKKKDGDWPKYRLESYESKRIETEKSWVLSEVQIWTLMKKGKKRWGFFEIQIWIYIGM